MAGELLFLIGATGFIGFAVLLEALRASQAEELRWHHLITPFASKLESVVVADITVPGAFDDVLGGVTFIEHVASPLPNPVRSPLREVRVGMGEEREADS